MDIDLTQDVLFHIHTGLIFLAVCAPASWSAEKVEEEANIKAGNPGTSNGRWVITDHNLPEGVTENPVKCADDENRRHWILNC